jgi:outer membrane lipoprotein-sorting protein
MQSKKLKNILLCCALFFCSVSIPVHARAQTDPLIEKVAQKLAQVNDYLAEGVMKTDVSFIKASLGKVKVYFKKPNLLKVKKEGGISLLPRGGVSLTINTLINTKQYTTIPAGTQVLNGKNLTVIKLIPTDDNLDWVISTLWIDPVEALVYKTATTTKENGSYEITMQYGEYGKEGLASKIIFSFNTKDYKLPNGITLEFGDEDPTAKQKALKNKKGTIEITYSKYTINKGIPNNIF